MKKVMLLGNTGKMGSAIMSQFSQDYSVLGYNSTLLDVTCKDLLLKEIDLVEPDIIINTVGSVGIDASECNWKNAYELNAVVPYVIAKKAAECSIPFIHFSTNAVFDGESERPYVESDAPNPKNIYGLSKKSGEDAVLNLCNKGFVVRTSTLVGNSKRGTQLFERLIQKVKEGGTHIQLSDDLFGSPSYTIDVAFRLKALLESEMYGIHHIANEGSVSIYEYIEYLFNELGIDAALEKVSHRLFKPEAIQPQHINITTEKSSCLRNWKAALCDYASHLNYKESTIE